MDWPRMSLSQQETTVDRERRSGDERGLFRAQKDNRIGDFVRRGNAAKRDGGGNGLRTETGTGRFCVVQKAFEHRRPGRSRSDFVDANAELCRLGRRGTGKRTSRALAGVVKAVSDVRHLRGY